MKAVPAVGIPFKLAGYFKNFSCRCIQDTGFLLVPGNREIPIEMRQQVNQSVPFKKADIEDGFIIVQTVQEGSQRFFSLLRQVKTGDFHQVSYGNPFGEGQFFKPGFDPVFIEGIQIKYGDQD